MRIIRLVIDYLLGSLSPGSARAPFPPYARRSGVQGRPRKLAGDCELAHEAGQLAAARPPHSRVHMDPLINCFTGSDSQLSQPPASVMILLSSAFFSCRVCSCMINLPFLSSPTAISYRFVITTQKKRVLLTLLLCRELEFWI